MLNHFLKAVENEMIPVFEQLGAKVLKKQSTQVTFIFKDVAMSICLERDAEVYVVVSTFAINGSVYLSELLSDFLNVEDKGIYHLSERFTIEDCMRKLAFILTSKIFPLIIDGNILEAMKIIISNRKEGLRKYNQGIIEKAAERAFKGKRYVDVVLCYTQLSELNEIQKKRLEISKGKIAKE